MSRSDTEPIPKRLKTGDHEISEADGKAVARQIPIDVTGYQNQRNHPQETPRT